jgi:hypothetical protein
MPWGTSPADDRLVQELAPIVEVQTGYRVGYFTHRGPQSGEDVGVGVVTDGAGEHPAGVHIGQVQRAGELALECGPAVRDGIALEETGFGFHFVGGFTDRDRISQQR